MQAHLIPSPGVWKQLNSAPAPPSERRYHESQNEKGYSHVAPPVILVEELSDIVAEDQR